MSSFELVKEFQRAMSQPVADKPTMLDRGSELDKLALRMAANRLERAMDEMKATEHGGRIMKRASWILEELIEFIRAESLVDQVDAIADIRYLTDGTSVELGVDPEPCLAIVHGCNMDKLGMDGKPIIDAQGKVRKRTGWVGPETKLFGELERQRRCSKS